MQIDVLLDFFRLHGFTLSGSELYNKCMTRQEIESLFKAHYTRMYRLAASILYDEDESKDVVSEVFARLLSTDITLRENSAEAYLLAAVRNRCRNVLEHKQVRERFQRLLSCETVQLTDTVAEGEQLRMAELLQHMEEHLSPLSLQIFRLRYLQEMTGQEVADALGISRQTVHSHLRKSIEQIRAFLS